MLSVVAVLYWPLFVVAVLQCREEDVAHYSLLAFWAVVLSFSNVANAMGGCISPITYPLQLQLLRPLAFSVGETCL